MAQVATNEAQQVPLRISKKGCNVFLTLLLVLAISGVLYYRLDKFAVLKNGYKEKALEFSTAVRKGIFS